MSSRNVDALGALLETVRSQSIEIGEAPSAADRATFSSSIDAASELAKQSGFSVLYSRLKDLKAVVQSESFSQGALVEAALELEQAAQSIETPPEADSAIPEDERPQPYAGSTEDLTDLMNPTSFQRQLQSEATERDEVVLILRLAVPVKERLGVLTGIEQSANVIATSNADSGAYFSLLCSFPEQSALFQVLAEIRGVPHQIIHAGKGSTYSTEAGHAATPSIDYRTAEQIGLVLDGIGATMEQASESYSPSVISQLSVLKKLLNTRERRSIGDVIQKGIQQEIESGRWVEVSGSPTVDWLGPGYGSWIRLMEPMAGEVERLVRCLVSASETVHPFGQVRFLAGEHRNWVRVLIRFDDVDDSWWECLAAAVFAGRDGTGMTNADLCSGTDVRTVKRTIRDLSGQMGASVFTNLDENRTATVGLNIANNSDLRSVYLATIGAHEAALPRLYTDGPFALGTDAVIRDRLGGRFIRIDGEIIPLSPVHREWYPDETRQALVCRYPTRTNAVLVDSVDGPRMVRACSESFQTVCSLDGTRRYRYLTE